MLLMQVVFRENHVYTGKHDNKTTKTKQGNYEPSKLNIYYLTKHLCPDFVLGLIVILVKNYF